MTRQPAEIEEGDVSGLYRAIDLFPPQDHLSAGQFARFQIHLRNVDHDCRAHHGVEG
jgi:hypothetical protein